MKKFISLLVTFWLMIAALVTFPTSAIAEEHSNAFSELAACARSENTTDFNIFFLIDSSESLSKDFDVPASDPKDLRANILSQTIEQLSSLNKQKRVNFALDTFDTTSPGRAKSGETYSGYDWTEATDANVASASNWVMKKIPEYDKGQATNWLAGLKRAQSQLAKAPHGDGEVCQAIIWFTDGGLNVRGDDGAAIAELCGVPPTASKPSTSGVIQSLRANGVNLIGVLLTPEKGKNFDGGPGFDGLVSYFGPIVKGSGTVDGSKFKGTKGQHFECGQFPVPAAYASGEVLIADDPDALARQFIGLIEQIIIGAPIELAKDNKFYVDKGVSEVSVVIPSATWDILRPNNLPKIVSSSRETGFRISTIGNTSVVRFQVKPGYEGLWQVNHDGKSPVTVFMQSGLKIELDSNVKIEVGKGNQTISGKIVNSNGKPLDLSVYTSLEMSVVALDESGMDRRGEALKLNVNKAAGTWTGPFAPFSGGSTSRMRITLAVNTAHMELPAISQNFNPPLIVPDQFASLDNSNVKLSNLIFTEKAAKGELILLGAKQGVSSVKFSTPKMMSDVLGRGIDRFSFKIVNRKTGKEVNIGEWQNIDENDRVAFAIDIDSDSRADGDVLISLPVQIRPSTGGELLDSVVKVSFTEEVPTENPIVVSIVISIVGILLPLLLLHLVNYFFSRYKFRDTRVASVPVLVAIKENSVLIKPGVGREKLLGITDFSYVESSKDATRVFPVEYGSQVIATLKSKLPKNPFGSSTGYVSAQPGSVVVSSENPMSTLNGRVAGASLNPNRYYFAVAQPGQSPIDSPSKEFEAVLTLFMSTLDEGNVDKQIQEIAREISESGMWGDLGSVSESKAIEISKVEEKVREKKEKKVRGKKEQQGESEVKSSTNEGSQDFDPDDPWA